MKNEAIEQPRGKQLPKVYSVTDAISDFTIDLRMKRRAQKTRLYYESVFRVFQSIQLPVSISDVTEDHIRTAMLTKENAPYMYLHIYAALKTFFRWMIRRHVIVSNPMEFIDRPKMEDRLLPTVPTEEYKLLLINCNDAAIHNGLRSYTSVRDEAIIRFLFDTGLRCSEMVGMQISNINIDDQVCRVLGKGNKWRTIHFGVTVQKALWEWIKIHNRRHDDVWLSLEGTPLTTHGIAQILERRCKRLGLHVYSPHKWRHTMAVNMLMDGAPISAVQRQLGHTRASTTEIYLRNVNANYAISEHAKHSPGDNL